MVGASIVSLGLTKRLLEADGGRSHVFDHGMVDSLKADVRQELQTIFSDLKMPTAKTLPKMLTRAPMPSFRDVDAPIGFGTLNMSQRALDKLPPAGEMGLMQRSRTQVLPHYLPGEVSGTRTARSAASSASARRRRPR